MSELPPLVKALLDPQIYPEPAQKVELVQTGISYVFLTEEYVYKIKKPVDLGFLDYTTLEKRRRFCEKEVELNRRLCPEGYLGVLKLTRDGDAFRFGGDGPAEEYAVKMRRLPQEAMLETLLPAGRVTPEMMEKLAARLAAFHEKAATGDEISAFGSIEAVTRNVEENFTQTEKYIGITLLWRTYQQIKDYAEGFIRENAGLFRQRMAAGRIRDCHGDLHTAHICFTDDVCIYDCIEFSDRFRYCDVASEIAFLAMDLDRYGRPDLSESFVAAYIKASGDGEIARLLNFYKSYRAYVRGKVACFQCDDPYISAGEKEKAVATARGYFELAAAYIG